jgi:flagellar hook-associated protein 1 FlgK
MPLSVALTTALSGLGTAQTGMQTVSQNIANVNTQGYARKTVQPLSQTLAGLGSGVQIGLIRREVEEFLNRDLRDATSGLFERQTRQDYLSRIEQLFGGPQDQASLGSVLSRFRSALEALATAPENLGLRGETIRAGQELTDLMNTMSSTVQQVRAQADQALAEGIVAVNSQTSLIAELNRQIVKGLVTQQDVTDLQDQRDRAVMAISEQMRVTTYTRADGSIVVATAAGRALVDGAFANAISYTAQTNVIASTVFNDVTLGGVNITNEFSSGRLAALVQQRDTTLPARTAELNQLAIQLRNTITSTSLATTDLVATATVNEINRFFIGVDPANIDNAGGIRVHSDLIADPALLNNLTAARDLANASASNAVVFAASGQLPSLTTGFAAYGNSILSNVASTGAQASYEASYQASLHGALAHRVGEVSGVNLDEEMARMVEWQRAYNAAARMVQASSEMLQVLEDMVR